MSALRRKPPTQISRTLQGLRATNVTSRLEPRYARFCYEFWLIVRDQQVSERRRTRASRHFVGSSECFVVARTAACFQMV
jgi:hypothetical protein